MSPLTTLARTRAAVFTLACLAAVASCSVVLGFQEPRAEQGCILNSDCAPSKVCIFRACSVRCAEDVDCPTAFRCLKTASANACVDATKTSCDQMCPSGTGCAVDRVCRTSCTTATDCLARQTCVSGSCIGNDSSHDPSLDGGTGPVMSSEGGESGPPVEAGGENGSDAMNMGVAMLSMDHQPSYDFGPVLINMTSAPVTLIVTNAGTGTSGSLSAASVDDPDFQISRDNCMGQTLVAGATCTVLVTMMAAKAGMLMATVSLGASPGGNVSTMLRGSVVAPGALALSPPSFTFVGPVDAGMTASQTFTVSNTGNVATSALEAPTLMGDSSFKIAAENCMGAILAPAGSAGSSCTVSVQFAPTAFGAQSTTLRDSATIGGLATSSVVGTGRQTFSLTVTNSGGGSVTSTPAGDISCGSTCSKSYVVTTAAPTVSLTATPSGGLGFARWTGDCTGAGSCSVQLGANRTVGATFSATLQVTISASGSATGTVSSTMPAGFSCASANCSKTYDYNTAVTLTNTPGLNSTFNGWTGDCSGTTNCALTMNQAHTLGASFVGKCVAAASAKHYVDHVNGTNDTDHGGGTGACAYKTLGYALTQATGQISLVMTDTFQNAMAGEAAPFTLTGSQSLLCNGAGFTTIANQSITSGMLNIQGTNNSVTGCKLTGAGVNVGGSGTCMIVKTSGAGPGAAGHTITQNTFTQCDVGIDVVAGVTNVAVSLNVLGTMAAYGNDGIVFEMGNSGSLTGNQMYGYFDDVVCPMSSGGSPNVTGSGNTRNGSAIACFGCTHCATF